MRKETGEIVMKGGREREREVEIQSECDNSWRQIKIREE